MRILPSIKVLGRGYLTPTTHNDMISHITVNKRGMIPMISIRLITW